MELEVLYCDEHFVAVNKPNGLLVHRTKLSDEEDEFALQIVRNQFNKYVFPIHRLDRKTSGVLLFAFSSEIAKLLQEELAKDSTQKRYEAIVRGYFPEKVELDHPLKNDKEVIQEAQTNFNCLKQIEIDIPLGKYETSRYSLIEAFPKTGRMHQIRKHCNHLRHPIIGDRPHGCNKQNKLFLEKFELREMMLHAESIVLNHPTTKEPLKISAPFFEPFKRIRAILDL